MVSPIMSWNGENLANHLCFTYIIYSYLPLGVFFEREANVQFGKFCLGSTLVQSNQS